MSRFVSPFERVTDNDNKPIVGAKLFFYQTGTKTLKTIYLDFENQIPAENPVISLAGGINPDRYINGIYNIVQTDNTGAVGAEGALIWERDPVGDLDTGPFGDWNSTSFYSLNDVVKGSDLAYYISTVAGINTNQGNDPISSPSEWDIYLVVTIDGVQTITGVKTIESPVINTPVINGVAGYGLVILDTPELLDTVATAGLGVWYDEVSDSWTNNTLTTAGATKAIIKVTANIASTPGSWVAFCRINGSVDTGTILEFARTLDGATSGSTTVNLDSGSLFEWRVDGTFTAGSVSLILVGYYI